MSNVLTGRLATGKAIGKIHRVDPDRARRTLCGWRITLRMEPTTEPVNCRDCARLLENGRRPTHPGRITRIADVQ